MKFCCYENPPQKKNTSALSLSNEKKLPKLRRSVVGQIFFKKANQFYVRQNIIINLSLASLGHIPCELEAGRKKILYSIISYHLYSV